MIYELENQRLKVQVNSMGAEMWSIFDKHSQTEHLWQGDPSVWGRRAPVLFPICGKLVNDSCVIDGKTYSIPMHGFARDYEHQVIAADKDSLSLRFTQSEETLRRYPFRFSLDTRYRLEDNRLSCTFEVTNAGDGVLPFSIGYHAGFQCPFDSQRSIEDYSLVFEKKETAAELLCDGFLTGGQRNYLHDQDIIPLHDRLFPNSFILTGLQSDYVGIVEKDTGREVRVFIKGFPYVTFWSTPNKVPFVCIEPWYGVPDPADTDGDFRKKPGIQKIAPGECFCCTQTIEIRDGAQK